MNHRHFVAVEACAGAAHLTLRWFTGRYGNQGWDTCKAGYRGGIIGSKPRSASTIALSELSTNDHGSVTTNDVALFVNCLTGPGIPGSPHRPP